MTHFFVTIIFLLSLLIGLILLITGIMLSHGEYDIDNQFINFLVKYVSASMRMDASKDKTIQIVATVMKVTGLFMFIVSSLFLFI